MCDAHNQREHEEHRLLRQHRTHDFVTRSTQLGEDAAVLAGIGDARKLLDGEDGGASNDQDKSDIDRQIADQAVHRVRALVILDARRLHAPQADLMAVRVAQVRRPPAIGAHVTLGLLVCEALAIVAQKVARIQRQVRALSNRIGNNDRSGIAAHARIGKRAGILIDLFGLRVQRHIAKRNGNVLAHGRVVHLVHRLAHVGREQVPIRAQIDLAQPAERTITVVVALFHDLQTHDV